MKKIIGVDGICGLCNGKMHSHQTDTKGYEMKKCSSCGHKVYKVIDARGIIRETSKHKI